jgi:hypothetical protein
MVLSSEYSFYGGLLRVLEEEVLKLKRVSHKQKLDILTANL